MKKFILQLLILTLSISLITGCNKVAEAPENEAEIVEQERTPDSDVAEVSDNEKSEAPEAKVNVFPFDLGAKANEIVKVLGNPESKSEEAVEAYDGQYHQRSWSYEKEGIELSMVRESLKHDQLLESITLTSPCKFSISGITVGDARDDVIKAHTDNINSQDSRDFSSAEKEIIVVGSIYDGIVFTIDAGKVSTIFVGASAE